MVRCEEGAAQTSSDANDELWSTERRRDVSLMLNKKLYADLGLSG